MNRPRKKRRTKPRLLFFVEGKTEKAFFDIIAQEYRLTAARSIVILDSSGSDWIQKSKSIIKNNKNFKPDSKAKIFIIFDKNADDPEQINKMLSYNDRTMDDAKVKIGFSNSAFEVWLLAHYEKIGKSLLEEKKLEEKLSQHLGKDYQKADYEQMRSIIKDDKTYNAIENSREIRAYSTDEQSTNIGEILEEILEKEN